MFKDCEGVTGVFIGQSVSNSKNWVHLIDFFMLRVIVPMVI
jgi:hypothetical protein